LLSVLAAFGVTLGAPVAQATVAGQNGRIAFSSYGEIYTVLPDGSGLRQVQRRQEDEKNDWYPAWSPDGTRIATGGEVVEPAGNGSRHWSDTDLQLFAPDGSGFTRLSTPKQHFSTHPAWSPDGRWIAYLTDEPGYNSISKVAPGGSNVQMLVEGFQGAAAGTLAWAPDGSRLVFSREIDSYGETDLFTMRPDGRDVRRLLARPGLDSFPSWSPDGTTIAFSGSRPRQGDDVSRSFPGTDVYVVPAAGGEPSQLTHTDRDSDPDWAPDGTAIVFQSDRQSPPGTLRPDLYLMTPSGGNQRPLTSIGCLQCGPAWQPRAAAFGARTRVTLKLAAKPIDGRSPLRVVISNANSFAITGDVRGETVKRVFTSRKQRLRLKPKRFRVGARTKTTAKLKLPRTWWRLLKRKPKMKVRIIARVRDPAGHVRAVKRNVMLKRKSSGRRR
jgi:TolB protein